MNIVTVSSCQREELAQQDQLPSLRPQRYPCSAGQRRFWLLNQIYPGSSSLHVAVRWRLEGTLATAHLEQGFRMVLLRHQALRASFSEAAGELAQTIEPQVTFRLPEIDLRSLPPHEAEAEAERIARLEARASFDLLATPPFIRATRLCLNEQVSVLLVSAHHIVMDGWSAGILAHELCEICAALQGGRIPRLQPLGVEFCDWCAAQAAAPAPLSDEEGYWRAALDGARHFELLPDRARPPVKAANGGICATMLPRTLSLRLVELSQHRGCTLFMTVAAALLVLLHRYSGETDICIGTQTPGRDEVELEDLIGPFVNTLVLRNDLSDDPAFDELLDRVSRTAADAFEHRNLPLEKIVDIVRPPRDLSRHPLFSVNFVLHRPYVKDMDYGSFRLIDLPPVSSGSMYDLCFSMVERPQGWELSCEYDTELFADATAARLLSGLQTVLNGVVADSSRRLSQLPVMEQQERAALLAQGRSDDAAYPQLGAAQLFERQAAQRAEAVALVCGERSLRYAELEGAANRLARELRERGLGRGSRVALFLNRSPDLVIALLAVLKCGAAYVPIDPSYPEDRIAYLVANAGVAALISTAPLAARLDAPGASVLLLDQEAPRLAAQSAAPLDPVSQPDDPAYVIYTSGSTGKPKGVQVAHRGLVNLLWFTQGQPGLSAADRFLALSTISFDIATLELLLPLSVGATLVLAGEQQAADGEAIIRLLEQHDVTATFAAPVTWQLLLLAGWTGRPGLRMWCGGEALSRQLAEALLCRGAELWNLYGPTETTVLSSALRVRSGDGPVLLGPPIANTRFYVLDRRLEPVPPGAPGELYIGGDGVGLGYLGLPELTRERFIDDPFGAPGERLYRSGDVVRLRGGGQLEYLGRADRQVKLRGLRIELGEIESVLLDQPELADALAVVNADVAGGTLVAYVVPRDGRGDGLIELLRQRLAQFLPRYMCPSAYLVLPALPRLPNGKIDRQSLPPPAATSVVAEVVEPATNQVERDIAAIWCSILGCESVDPAANFFELGGHSLLAAQMLTRLEQQFGQRISLSALFQEPTVRGLCRLLTQGAAREYDFRQVIKLQPNGTRSPLIAINNTGIYGLLAKRLGSERPFTSLQLFDPAVKEQPPAQTLEDIAAAYVQLIRRVQPEGPYALLGWCVAGTLAFEIARQLSQQGMTASHLFMIDTHVPRFFARMPWWRRLPAQYSQRLQLIARDWSRVRRGEQSIGAFLAHRVSVQRLLRRFGRPPADATDDSSRTGDERYDQWLLHYLQRAAERYEPRPYAGRLVLFRSADQPRGRFLDWAMGWAGSAAEGVDVVEVAGDHFSIFRDPGVGLMAQQISRLLDASAGVQAEAPR